MPDMSRLDKKYFIDEKKYNCPFCNRRSVVYQVISVEQVDWSEKRVVNIYRVRCGGCEAVSLHLSDFLFGIDLLKFGEPQNSEGDYIETYKSEDLDEYFFYHQPSSFFIINSLIPKDIRELLAEAEGCRKMSYFVGASGALRKAIYEFLKHQKAEGKHYEDKIKWLKNKYKNIYSEYFDAMSNIQDMTSENLHEKEGSWIPWVRKDFDYLMEVTKTVLEEIYVKPDERKSILAKITGLKKNSAFDKEKVEECKDEERK